MTSTPPPPVGPPNLPEGPPAYIDLTVQGSGFTSSFIAPDVSINGYPIPAAYGRRMLAVPPGPVRVDVAARWTRTYGRASTVFVAAPGQTVPLFYASPHHVFADGAIGHVPQKRPGLGVAIVVLSLAIAVPVALVLALAAFTSLAS